MSTVIFAAVAIFFVWKLRAVLGQKSGSEERGADRAAAESRKAETPAGAGNVVRLPGAAAAGAAPADAAAEKWAGFAEGGSPVAAGLDAVAALDAGFSARGFIDGARRAYEMIITAFAAADRKTLKPLLASDVYDSFSHAIGQREAAGQTMTTTFVSLDKAEFSDAQVRGGAAILTIRFRSKLVNTTVDRAGQPIDDMQGKVTDSVDIWSFSREIVSRDPNWKLVATESAPAAARSV